VCSVSVLKKRETNNAGCWLWKGALIDDGYGVVNGFRLHHLSCLAAELPLPIEAKTVTAHLCKNKRCFKWAIWPSKR